MLLIITSIFQSIVIIVLGVICWSNRQTIKGVFKALKKIEEFAKFNMELHESEKKILKEITNKVFGEPVKK